MKTYRGVGGLEVAELVAGLVGPGARVVGRVLGRVGQVGGGVRPGGVLALLTVGHSVLALQRDEVGIGVGGLLHGGADVGHVHHTRVLVVVLDGALHVAHEVRQQHLQIVGGRHGGAGVEVGREFREVALLGVGGQGVGGVLEGVKAGLAREVDDGLAHHVHVLGEVGLRGHGGGGRDASVGHRRVLQSKPGGQVAGVGATDGDHLAVGGLQVALDVADDASQVSEGLVSRQVLQVRSAHVIGRVGLSVESVLHIDQKGSVLLSKFIRIHVVGQAGATFSALASNIHKDGEINTTPVLSVQPVSLSLTSPLLLSNNRSKVIHHGILEPVLINFRTSG